MSAIEDFENAPVGATATSPDGRKTYRRAARTPGGADWTHEAGDAALWAYGDDLAHFRYTLGPAPAPAPVTPLYELPSREQIADTIYDALEEAGWISTSGHYPYEIADAVLALMKGQEA